jgi:hypothetical protein
MSAMATMATRSLRPDQLNQALRRPLDEAIVDLVVGLRQTVDHRNDLLVEQCRPEVLNLDPPRGVAGSVRR